MLIGNLKQVLESEVGTLTPNVSSYPPRGTPVPKLFPTLIHFYQNSYTCELWSEGLANFIVHTQKLWYEGLTNFYTSFDPKACKLQPLSKKMGDLLTTIEDLNYNLKSLYLK